MPALFMECLPIIDSTLQNHECLCMSMWFIMHRRFMEFLGVTFWMKHICLNHALLCRSNLIAIIKSQLVTENQPHLPSWFSGTRAVPGHTLLWMWMVAKSQSPVDRWSTYHIIHRVSTCFNHPTMVVSDFWTLHCTHGPMAIWRATPHVQATAPRWPRRR